MKIKFNKEEKTLTIGEKVFEDVEGFLELETCCEIEKTNGTYEIFSKEPIANAKIINISI